MEFNYKISAHLVESLVSTESSDIELEKKILAPLLYYLDTPSKCFGTNLLTVFNYWLKVPEEKLVPIGEIIHVGLMAALVIDDIYDSSTQRRGLPTAHVVYGMASSFNAGNLGLFLGMEKVLKLGHPLEGCKLLTKSLLDYHRGQGIEMYWRDNFMCPTEEAFMDMAAQKTSPLFSLAIGLPQLESDNKTDFSKLMRILTLYYNIRDDYCNLVIQEYSDEKGCCEDLTEGKFSLPIIHALRNEEKGKEILNILRQRTKDVEVKKYCMSLLEQLGSLQYTRDTMNRLEAEARDEVSRLGENPYIEVLLDAMGNWRRSTKENNS